MRSPTRTRRIVGNITLLFGLLIGIGGGLFYGYNVNPVRYGETTPIDLSGPFKEQYVLMIAAAYNQDGDIARANRRMQVLGLSDPASRVAAFAQQSASRGAGDGTLSLLNVLAAGLTADITPTLVADATSVSNDLVIPTVPPTAPTVAPIVATVPPTPVSEDYQLLAIDSLCDPTRTTPEITVELRDENGDPLAGIPILVKWENNVDQFWTGLKPEINLGYADFEMAAGTLYTLEVGNNALPVRGLIAEDCTDDEGRDYPGSMDLVFQRN